jgi:hypothetical protein
MRTKTLLITAALAAAGLVSASAQVYSVNAVGYVNLTIPANGYRIISNPLNGNPDNNLNTILALPQDGSFDGASVYRYNSLTQTYRDTMQWVSGPGWLASAPEDLVVNPGEGFFLQNIAGQPLNITMVGEVPSGTTQNPIQGDSKYTLASALVPRGGQIGYTGLAGSLEFPADTGDSLYIFNYLTQGYEETAQYVEGVGWLHATFPPEGPTINPGEGFFVQKLAPNRNWTMTFTVN